MLKAVLVGAGPMGARYINNIWKVNGLTLAEICDSNTGRASSLVSDRKRPPRILDRYGQALESDSEVVIIATPTTTHAEFLKQAVEVGKHVLVEKPVCLTWEETNELEDIALGKGQQVAVGYLTRFSRNIEIARRFISENKLIPYHSDIRWTKDRPNISKHYGVIGQEVTHPLDLMLHMLIGHKNIVFPGDIYSSKPNPDKHENDAEFYLNIDGHIIRTITSFKRTERKRQISIYCRRPDSEHEYRILLAFDKDSKRGLVDRLAVYSSEHRKWFNIGMNNIYWTHPRRFREYHRNKLVQQLRAFTKSVESGVYDPRLCNLEQARRNVRVTEIIKSRPQHKYVDVPYEGKILRPW